MANRLILPNNFYVHEEDYVAYIHVSIKYVSFFTFFSYPILSFFCYVLISYAESIPIALETMMEISESMV